MLESDNIGKTSELGPAGIQRDNNFDGVEMRSALRAFFITYLLFHGVSSDILNLNLKTPNLLSAALVGVATTLSTVISEKRKRRKTRDAYFNQPYLDKQSRQVDGIGLVEIFTTDNSDDVETRYLYIQPTVSAVVNSEFMQAVIQIAHETNADYVTINLTNQPDSDPNIVTHNMTSYMKNLGFPTLHEYGEKQLLVTYHIDELPNDIEHHTEEGEFSELLRLLASHVGDNNLLHTLRTIDINNSLSRQAAIREIESYMNKIVSTEEIDYQKVGYRGDEELYIIMNPGDTVLSSTDSETKIKRAGWIRPKIDLVEEKAKFFDRHGGLIREITLLEALQLDKIVSGDTFPDYDRLNNTQQRNALLYQLALKLVRYQSDRSQENVLPSKPKNNTKSLARSMLDAITLSGGDPDTTLYSRISNLRLCRVALAGLMGSMLGGSASLALGAARDTVPVDSDNPAVTTYDQVYGLFRGVEEPSYKVVKGLVDKVMGQPSNTSNDVQSVHQELGKINLGNVNPKIPNTIVANLRVTGKASSEGYWSNSVLTGDDILGTEFSHQSRQKGSYDNTYIPRVPSDSTDSYIEVTLKRNPNIMFADNLSNLQGRLTYLPVPILEGYSIIAAHDKSSPDYQFGIAKLSNGQAVLALPEDSSYEPKDLVYYLIPQATKSLNNEDQIRYWSEDYSELFESFSNKMLFQTVLDLWQEYRPEVFQGKTDYEVMQLMVDWVQSGEYDLQPLTSDTSNQKLTPEKIVRATIDLHRSLCNTAAATMFYSTIGMTDPGSRLALVTGFYNRPESGASDSSLLSSREAHAWNTTRGGEIVDSTPFNTAGRYDTYFSETRLGDKGNKLFDRDNIEKLLALSLIFFGMKKMGPAVRYSGDQYNRIWRTLLKNKVYEIYTKLTFTAFSDPNSEKSWQDYVDVNQKNISIETIEQFILNLVQEPDLMDALSGTERKRVRQYSRTLSGV
ncbi:hypothetical protein KA531_03555 [Candidatus Saccharibacteria bacterium]|nr:hypothetical protein [Candidatus Saccharibacteria bacterium]